MFQAKSIWILFLLGISMAYAQDVQFEVKISKEKIGLNERLRVIFEMNKDGDNFDPPDFANFQVVMGPIHNISQSWVNGKFKYSKAYTYIVSPVKKGKLRIGQASITIDGTLYKTSPKTVEVTAAVSNPSINKTADNVADENIHLVAELSKSKPFLNEGISIVYKLYVSPNVSVSNYEWAESPKYNNFWSQDIPITKIVAKTGTYKGEQYRYVVLKRVVLYPQKTGKLEIEPLLLNVSVDVPTNRRDFFGSRIYTQVIKKVAAGNLIIHSKPLPTEGRPANFSGAVGQFDFEVTASKSALNAGESLQAKVIVSGKGNLKLLDIPKLQLPAALEVYDPEVEQKVATTLSGMQGKVLHNYTVVPAYQGIYPIPKINFNYFDPKSASYKSIASEELIVDVIEGPTNNTQNTNTNTVNKQVVVANNNTFLFNKTSSHWLPVQQNYFFGSKAYYLWLLLPLLAIPIAWIVDRKQKKIAADVTGNKVRKANRLAKKYLSAAKKALDKEDAFYIALEKALHNYLKAKLHIETSDFSKDKIQQLLEDKGVSSDGVVQFLGLLKNCELARYTPATSSAMQSDYNQAVEVIAIIDKHL
ncbi:MAG: BatD family protein [Flavobacteriaceae bacterium]|nr:BatD family protein [Flavobacteriaceae bacterium]